MFLNGSAGASAAAHRLGEGHAGDRSVEHPHPDQVERVEAHGVPDPDVRSEQLDKEQRQEIRRITLDSITKSNIFMDVAQIRRLRPTVPSRP